MMASPTKRQEWSGSIKSFFRMKAQNESKEAIPPSLARSEQTPQDIASNQSDDAAEESFVSANTENDETMKSIAEQMAEAKKMYPGSKEWAKDEDRLFEILYLRQDIPMMPSHWNVDFRGFPIPEQIFEANGEYPPRIYAHSKSGSKEYSATAALTRLIDLTLSVRTLFESEHPDYPTDQGVLRGRAAALIKDTLDGYLHWAARDGGYANPKVIPNIAVEVVDTSDTQEGIITFVMGRMKALARLQREFYRDDRSERFWENVGTWTMATKVKKRRAMKNKRRARHAQKRHTKRRGTVTPELGWDELSTESTGVETPMQELDIGAKKRRYIRGSPPAELDELGDQDRPEPSVESDLDPVMSNGIDTPIKKEISPAPPLTSLAPFQISPEPSRLTFRRKPPVIYGLYVIGTSVFLITMDSSKGDTGYVSFHVEVNFSDNQQSVWNALTVALAVCAARDELMLRLDDFELAPVEECESDPDA